ncbi:MAG: alpha/beta fold hydrolase [Aminipila sp.]
MKNKKNLVILGIGLIVAITLILVYLFPFQLQESKPMEVASTISKSLPEDDIKQLISNGALNESSDGLTHPEDTISIAEFSKALLVSMGMDPGVKAKGYWADNYISVATYTGIINFGEISDPEKDISRMEMTKMIVRALTKGENCPVTNKTFFKDNASISDGNKEYVNIAYENGLINKSSGGIFNPNESVTRREAAKIIVTFLEKRSSFAETDSKYIKKEVNTNGIVADFYYNKKINNQKVVILLGGSEGGKSWSSHLDNKTRRDLLERGYAILSLAYFGTDGVPKTLQSIPLEYFEKSINWALSQPGIDKSGVAVMGASKGGEAALLLATYFPEKVKAVIGIVPSSNVFQGIDGFIPCNKDVSSWSYKGKDIPYAQLIKNNNFEKALKLWKKEQKIEWTEVYSDAIKNPEADKKSAIMLEKAKCPIFLLSGKQDQVWPSYQMCNKLVNRLKQYSYGYHFEHLTYEEADHDVQFVPGAWQKILTFIDTYYPTGR